MSLSSSLFTGTSGLKNMGNALQVTGNNISNLNTIGFKKGRTTFADTLYESVATQAGSAQMGRGMAVGAIAQNFDQGSFESTGNTTDISIGGDGFFVVRQSNSENTFYTRAGNFFFDKAGQLVNPEGYVVQGWNLDEDTGDDVGSITDLILAEFTSPPKKSEEITAITNLDADAASLSTVLSNAWDSGETTAISAGKYEYQTVVKAYDALGSTHDITIFYDKKSGTEWEYIVTCNPDEDNRNLVQNTDSKGLLARGNILFSQSSGDILDFTMSEFTGQIGNFTANGANTVDDVQYEIADYDGLLGDGYGFSLEFDGSNWNFEDIDNSGGPITAADLPPGYGNAKIVYSDGQRIHLAFNSDPTDTEPDIRIQLAQSAVAADSIGFDINDRNDLHVQGLASVAFTGQVLEDNEDAEYMINDPGVMDQDSDDVGIIWNPTAEKWYWSNPAAAQAAGTLIAGVATDNALLDTTTINYTNVADIDMVASDISVKWNPALAGGAGAWDWNMPAKAEDFFNVDPIFSPTNTPTPSIISTSTVLGAGVMATHDGTGVAAAITLDWDGTTWTAPGIPASCTVTVDPANSDANGVQFLVTDTLSTNNFIGRYSFSTPLTAAGSISFEIKPTPPPEYSDALLSTGAAPNDSIVIDFDGNGTNDIEFEVDPGGVGNVAAGDAFRFSTDPDEVPPEYANATLKGDQNEAVIDLDGSGNETDKDDIVFTFETPLVAGALNTVPYGDRSKILFDIKGSTAWTDITKDEIRNTGYFGFTTDFLGGEFGSTETDIRLNIGSRYDGINFVNDSLSSTQYSKSSSTIFQDADGYAAGDLQGVDVASDGILTGVYSNGQLIPLFRIGLAKFLNNFGLSNEGGNLFRETRDSGSAITNKPGENGLGTLAPNSLEMSNVDISEEFVALITNQRGFQANSKTITTVDDMMQTVIQMKR